MNIQKLTSLLTEVETLEEAKNQLANRPKNEQMKLLKDLDSFMQYIGYAGEHRVMSELMLHGVDAMDPSIDEGFDLVARKNDNIFYIQVKTTFLGKKDRYVFDLKEKNFKSKFGNKIKEVVVFVMIDATNGKNNEMNFLIMSVGELKKQKENKKVWYSKTTKKFRVNICLRDEKAFFWTLDNNVTKFLNNWNYFIGKSKLSKTVSA